ncbi:Cof-type HAD-IIB family hydrolase [Isobaculum melis]|uniref:Sugar-phosphatase n=1 Tax=Isobaculum melis TaxID=142588 RepID=A0A1H9TTZ5_9LACT|nr:Cof-type HAD-IIB family hydrolase [Isobaculum melis]SES00586.1 hypothetical protein SAMN04488559_11638 [Isobaculum melis]
MAIKLIAVDMDGTFLNDQKTYNRSRFMEQYQEMKRQGIHFVVASGNQYAQLASFFPEIAAEIAFVAENGAYVVNQQQDIFVGEMERAHIQHTLKVLEQHASIKVVLCGRNSAYIQAGESEAFFQYAQRYYHQLKRVEDLYQVEDTLFKFGLSVPENESSSILAQLQLSIGQMLTPVSSGHGDMDLIIPGLHKATGIQRLQKLWQVKDEETAAFGDNGNDLEMLAHVHASFAMANGSEAVKKTAKYQIASNNHDGVLATIDQILVGKYV